MRVGKIRKNIFTFLAIGCILMGTSASFACAESPPECTNTSAESITANDSQYRDSLSEYEREGTSPDVHTIYVYDSNDVIVEKYEGDDIKYEKENNKIVVTDENGVQTVYDGEYNIVEKNASSYEMPSNARVVTITKGQMVAILWIIILGTMVLPTLLLR